MENGAHGPRGLCAQQHVVEECGVECVCAIALVHCMEEKSAQEKSNTQGHATRRTALLVC